MASMERTTALISVQGHLRTDHGLTLSTILEANRRRSYVVLSDPGLDKKLTNTHGRAITQLHHLDAEGIQLHSALRAIMINGTNKGIAVTPSSRRVTITLHQIGHKRKHTPAALKSTISK
jgi:hypothetical protein